MDFDNILDSIGEFGLFQKVLYSLAGLISCFAGVHMLSNVFTMASPSLRCYSDSCDTQTSKIIEPWSNFTVSGSCELFNQFEVCMGNVSDKCNQECFSNTTSDCSSWLYDKSDFLQTTVTEWNLVCSNSWKVSTSESVFMAGTLFGAFIFGTLGDKYGRRSVFMVCPILWSSSAIVTAFTRDWITYTVARMISAASLSGIYATSFVVVVEFIGMSKRAWCGNVFQIIFACGELLLALLAYSFRNWRHLQLVISVPIVIFIAYPWLIPESVRWQLSNGRYNDAKMTILKVARRNKKVVSDDMLEELFEISSQKRQALNSSGFLHILKSPVLLRRSLNIFFNWTVNSLVYYGLSLSASNLGGNTYINFMALAAVEIPAIIIATFVQQRKGRRIVLCSVMLLGGIACVSSAFIPNEIKWLATSLAIFGKSNIAASFAVIYIYSAEIFPTSLRTTGIGISSMCSRIGGVLAPLVANLGLYSPALPMLIFGCSSILAGFLSLALPETHNKKLPETVEEAERFGRKRSRTSTCGSMDESALPLLSD